MFFFTFLITIFFASVSADCSAASAPSSESVRSQLTQLIKDYGFTRPTRSTVEASRPWRCGAPNYDGADLLFFRGKTKNHTVGGLESIVENLVKEWEMEASHLNFSDWTTVSHKEYAISANGAPPLTGETAASEGNYNALLASVDESLWSGESFESSHETFRGAFPHGFAWELLEVLAGPPRVVFSWRHWATFDGVYRGREGDKKLYEMYGLAAVSVDNNLKVQNIEVFFKPDKFLRALQGEIDPSALRKGASIFGSGEPVVQEISQSQQDSSCLANQKTLECKA